MKKENQNASCSNRKKPQRKPFQHTKPLNSHSFTLSFHTFSLKLRRNPNNPNAMTPRVDDFENDNLSSTDDDGDDGFKEDMAALSRACMIVVPGSDDNFAAEDDVPSLDPLTDAGTVIVPVATDSDSDSDDQDDLECLKRVQSVYQPLSVLPPLESTVAVSDDDDDVDDLETVRAIMKRFGDYNEGI